MGIVYFVGWIKLNLFMKKTTDCTSIRKNTIVLNSLDERKMDKDYTLYFDESGNTRCFWIKDSKYNVDPFTHFILGGIVAKTSVEFDYAKTKIGCNSTIKEIKSKNVYKGTFEDCLRNQKLNNYLDLIIEQNWCVHFSVVELFNYAIVDIIDSITDDINNVIKLKNELYNVLRYNLDATVAMMIKYKYPNISSEQNNTFLSECIILLDNYISDTGKANEYIYELRYSLQSAQNKEELTFIQDEEEGNLLHDFLGFYQRKVYMFKNSHLIFDEEVEIQEKMAKNELMVDDKVLSNYQFVNSEDNVMIQLSDVFVGILARYFRFINTNLDHIEAECCKFNKDQIIAFKKLNKILRYSEKENSAFWDMFLGKDMRCMFLFLVETYGRL